MTKCSVSQVNQVGEVLRALGTNPTEGEVKKLIQSSCKVTLQHNYNPSIFTSYKFFLSLYLVITKAVFYGQIQWDIHGYVSRFFSSSSIQLQIQ